ncbi:MAG: carotenoid oxygenase family protein [Acidobacteriota bacterium]|nr:carotenoid oxygenase family protein [Acidobacteriota bacterium]
MSERVDSVAVPTAATGGTAAATATGGFAPGLERAFELIPEEGSWRLAARQGEVPPGIRGTCYSNGPARFGRGAMRYRHWLDGDGMVSALRFDSEGVGFCNRFVRSDKWRAEEAAGRFLYRTFGTGFPGDRLVRGVALESPVNVSVYPFAGTLLACGEQGQPWELDPVTLATRGRFGFGGSLNALSPFSAHLKIDAQTGELWNFGVSFSADEPRLNLYRFTPGGKLLYRRRLPLERPVSLHDFCLAGRHMVFYLSPYVLDLAALARQGRTLEESLDWRPELGSQLLVVARESGEKVVALPIGNRYSLHGINSFEEGDLLHVDVVELDRPVYDQYRVLPDLFTEVGPGRAVRFTVDLRRGELAGRRELGYELAPDFPAIDARRLGRSYDDLWMLGISATGRSGRKFFDQLVHLRWSRPEAADLWQAPPGTYLAAEPVFIPDSGGERGAAGAGGEGGSGAAGAGEGGGGGYILCPLLDCVRRESSFLLFDAHDVAAGPRLVLPLPSPIHLAFHACFAAE